MLWLPKWHRSPSEPALIEGVSRRTFLFLGGAAAVGALVAPTLAETQAINAGKVYRLHIGRNAFPPGLAFMQAVHNEMESLILDIKRHETDKMRRDYEFYRLSTKRRDDERATKNAARKARYAEWRRNTRSDGRA